MRLLPRVVGVDLAAEACEPTISQIRARLWDALSVARSTPTATPMSSCRGVETFGEEIPVSPEIDLTAWYTHVVVARLGAVGKTMLELDLARGCGVVVTEVQREGVVLSLGGRLRLQRGDVLSVVGPRSGLEAMAEILGPVEAGVWETDMALPNPS